MTRVLVTGSFDGLHPGHMSFFEQARRLGDELVVLVARDVTIERVKGRRPINNERDRLNVVAHVDLVDHALLGRLDDPYQAVADSAPDILALGYDQIEFTEKLAEELKKRGCTPHIVRLKPHRPEVYKSSKIGYQNHSTPNNA